MTKRVTLQGLDKAAASMKDAGFDAGPLELGFHLALAYMTGRLGEELYALDEELATKKEGVTVETIIKMTKYQVMENTLKMVLDVGQELSGDKFKALADALTEEVQ